MSSGALISCYNRGCGEEYDPEKNGEDSCRFHPGFPYFHDVYKGWTCCKKKSVDFTEFLNIKGCTNGLHSNEKPPEPEKKKPEGGDEEAVVVRAPISEPTLVRPPFETALVRIEPNINENFRRQIDELEVESKVEDKSKGTSNQTVTVGTGCKNRGCNASYQNPESNRSECVFHPGVPIFHEGLKYWSCCNKKTSDFSQFLAQKGCDVGTHKWLNDSDSSSQDSVKCRFDWHQTGNDVVVAVYAKLYDYRRSFVKLNPIRMQLHLVFPKQGNAEFNLDLELRGVVDVQKSIVSMLGTKIEITLAKAELGHWLKLDFPRQQLSVQDLKIEEPMANKIVEETTQSDSDDDLDDVQPIYPTTRITELPPQH